MTPTLRKSTQAKTQASIEAARKAGYVRQPRPRRKPWPRNKLFKNTNGLLNLNKSNGLQHITVANSNSPLLRLPPEIRNIIFTYALASSRRLPLYYNRLNQYSFSGLSTRAAPWVARSLGVRLPEVCRQIYSETATVLYRENLFSFITEKGMRGWLKKRLPAQLEAIRRLGILEWDKENRTRICEELKETVCPKLQRLTQNEYDAEIVDEVREMQLDYGRDYVSTDDECGDCDLCWCCC